MFNFNVSYFELESDFDPNDQNNVSVRIKSITFSFQIDLLNILQINNS